MAYVYEHATTYASFRPEKVDPRSVVLRGPSPSPPTPNASPGTGEGWSSWVLSETLLCSLGEDIVLIWTWVRHRELEPSKKAT